MHIKTNIELNIIHLVILAICPIMFIAKTSNEALCLAIMTICAFALSVFVCFLFNKVLTESAKIFVTAIVSSLIVTLLNYELKNINFMGLTPSDNYYFAVLSSIVLSVDIYFIDTKAVTNSVFSRTMIASVLFLLLYMIFGVIVEILSHGTIFGKAMFKSFSGIEFFASVPFSLLLLGLICAIAESIYRLITKKKYEKRIAYEKFVKKIRNEKIFQYDTLRRKQALATPIEVRHIGGEDIDEIKEKSNENKVVEDSGHENKAEETEKVEPKKRKKNKKMKVSKGAKVEQVFEKQSREDN
jgi:Na+-translocating ferredoxin:NAD+ oxidoreductase RnfE subunit